LKDRIFAPCRHLSFVEFDFGQGAAAANILIVISFVFALVYLRANRRAVTA
jgi:multiple sugar transport system permease protein